MGVDNALLENNTHKPDNDQPEAPIRHQHNGHGFSADLAVGLLSTTVVSTLTYPLHRVKVIIQTQDANPDVMSGAVKRYTALNSIPRIWREQGLASLWRGTTPYILRHVPGTSLSFAFRDFFQRLTPRYDAKSQFWQMTAVNIASGGLAGGAALAMVYPLEFATVRMAADLGGGSKRQFGSGIIQAWHQAIRSDGPLAIYRGFGVAAVSVIAYRGLYFGLYDSMKALGSPSTTHPSTGGHGSKSMAQQHTVATAVDYDSMNAPSSPSTTHPSTDSHGSKSTAQHAAPTAVGPGAAEHAMSHSWRWLSGWERLLGQYALAQACVYATVAVTYPLDIIRKRMIIDAGAGEHRQFTSALDCARKIGAREGLRGFYRFFGYDLVFRLGGGVLLVLYDELKRVAGR